jgi:glycosyltransferase involved in cell wall biosynthesis
VRIPIGTELPPAPLDPLGEPPPRILFIGSFAHWPNVEAGQRLIDSIFPRVVARRPEAQLILVGADPPRRLRHAASGAVLVTGRVEDVRPYLNEAAVVVAPLSAGGGMRVKVLEALAAGKPLVASPLALEGLDVRSGEHVLAADGDEPFAEAILSLLDDPERRCALARSARAWAEANLRWDLAADEYERLYDSLPRGTRRQPGA